MPTSFDARSRLAEAARAVKCRPCRDCRTGCKSGRAGRYEATSGWDRLYRPGVCGVIVCQVVALAAWRIGSGVGKYQSLLPSFQECQSGVIRSGRLDSICELCLGSARIGKDATGVARSARSRRAGTGQAVSITRKGSARRPSGRPACVAVRASRVLRRSVRSSICPVWLSWARRAAILRGKVAVTST